MSVLSAGAPLRPAAETISRSLLVLFSFLSIQAHPVLAQERVTLPAEDRRMQVTLEDVFTAGAVDGAEWETFSRLSSVAFDREGNLLLLDGENPRLVKVSPTGELMAQIGREGGGPGEFGTPSSMTIAPSGSIVVFDLRQRGFTLFHPDGTFDRNVPLADGFQSLPGSRLLAHPSGRVLSSGMVLTIVGSGGIRTTGDPSKRPLHMYSLEDGSVETIFEGWAPEAPEASGPGIANPGGRAVVYASADQRAFESGFHFGVLPDGSLAVVDSVAYAVKVVGEDGGVRKILTRPIEPRAVTRRDQERERERRLAALESGGGPRVVTVRGGGVSTARASQPSEMAKEQIRKLEFADEIPVIQGLAIDLEGRIWLERSGPEVGERGPIDLLTAEGRYLGSLDRDEMRIPDAFGPHGLVAFIERDELDVPRVEVKRLTLG